MIKITSILVLYCLVCAYSLECTLGGKQNVDTKGVGIATPRDIRLRPGSDELWVALEDNDSMLIITLDSDNSVAEAEELHDVLGYHYMDQVSSLSFTDDGAWFGTCQESNNNYNDMSWDGNGFMGPSLWKTVDYTKVNQDNGMWASEGDVSKYGSHYDMNHEAPYCVGIEWWENNRYFAIDGSGDFDSNFMMFDFMEDHGPGGNDHSDAVVWRYEGETFTRVDRVSSQMRIAANGWLYIADTGANRVVRFQVGSGSTGNNLPYSQWPENLGAYKYVRQAVFETVVSDFTEPSAMAMVGDSHFIVGSHNSGLIAMYDLDGNLVEMWSNFDAPGLQSVLVHNDIIYAVNSVEDTITARSFTCDVATEPENPTDVDHGEDSVADFHTCWQYTTEKKCMNKGADACAWNVETEICDIVGAVGMCYNVPKGDCKAMDDATCVYDKPTKHCFPPPATPCWYPKKKYCKKAGYCLWDADTEVCNEQECTLVTKKGDCNRLDACKWNNNKKMCKVASN